MKPITKTTTDGQVFQASPVSPDRYLIIGERGDRIGLIRKTHHKFDRTIVLWCAQVYADNTYTTKTAADADRAMSLLAESHPLNRKYPPTSPGHKGWVNRQINRLRNRMENL